VTETDARVLREISTGGSRHRRLFYSGLLQARRGRLYLEGPDKERMMFGPPLSLNLAMLPKGLAGPEATIVLKNEVFFRHCLYRGLTGLEDSYARGDWDSADLPGVLAWVLRNREGSLFAEGWSAEGTGARLRLALERLLFSPGTGALSPSEIVSRRCAFREVLGQP